MASRNADAPTKLCGEEDLAKIASDTTVLHRNTRPSSNMSNVNDQRNNTTTQYHFNTFEDWELYGNPRPSSMLRDLVWVIYSARVLMAEAQDPNLDDGGILELVRAASNSASGGTFAAHREDSVSEIQLGTGSIVDSSLSGTPQQHASAKLPTTSTESIAVSGLTPRNPGTHREDSISEVQLGTGSIMDSSLSGTPRHASATLLPTESTESTIISGQEEGTTQNPDVEEEEVPINPIGETPGNEEAAMDNCGETSLHGGTEDMDTQATCKP